MTNDRSTNDSSSRTIIAAFLIVAALMMFTSYAVEGKPLREWWLPAALLIVGVALTLPQRSRPAAPTTPTAPRPESTTREYIVAPPAAESLSRDPHSIGSLASTGVAEPDPALSTEPLVEEINVPITETNVIEPLPPASAVTPPAPAITAQDLVRIDGIGPKIAAALYAAGIDSFEKLSSASKDRLRQILSDAGIRLAPSLNTWAAQAAFAARGDWEGMNRYNESRKS